MNQEQRIIEIKNRIKPIIHNSLFMIRKSCGFTLVELLIAMVIMGVLATLLMANFVGVRQRSRDGQRKADLRQIQSALELYRSDQGSYPASLPACGSELNNGGSPAVVYMKKIPCDPLNTGQYVYTYVFISAGTYDLFSCLENVNDSQKDTTNNSTYCTGGATNWSYKLTNP